MDSWFIRILQHNAQREKKQHGAHSLLIWANFGLLESGEYGSFTHFSFYSLFLSLVRCASQRMKIIFNCHGFHSLSTNCIPFWCNCFILRSHTQTHARAREPTNWPLDERCFSQQPSKQLKRIKPKLTFSVVCLFFLHRARAPHRMRTTWCSAWYKYFHIV